MGKKYMIKVIKDTDEVLPELHHGSIVELEELEEKKETLEDKLTYQCFGSNPTATEKCVGGGAAEIAKVHFQSHPEELGLVRIEDVLKVFDETRRSIFTEAFSSPVYLLRFTDAIKGLAHANP